jgi:hypothetical protein
MGLKGGSAAAAAGKGSWTYTGQSEVGRAICLCPLHPPICEMFFFPIRSTHSRPKRHHRTYSSTYSKITVLSFKALGCSGVDVSSTTSNRKAGTSPFGET